MNHRAISRASVLLFIGFLIAASACGDGDPRPSSAKELSGFSFRTSANPSLPADVAGAVSGTMISATLPTGTDVTALRATFSTTGKSVTVGGVAQISSVTANNFSSTVTYRVTAEDNTTRDYVVAVTVAASDAKALTSFKLEAAHNDGLAADIEGVINGDSIAATVPFGTNVGALVATFATTGVAVKIGDAVQVSGTTPNNFAAPVIYRVTAADNTTRDYTVAITVAANTAKAITSFAFLAVSNPVLRSDIVAEINGTAIAATVPFGTDVSALIASFSTTGASVKIGDAVQTSGITPNSFEGPIEYIVTAEDGSTQTYTVTVTIALDSAKALTEFAFLSARNPALSNNVIATINGFEISATVPFGTDVSALVATFVTTGVSVTVGGAVQSSGNNANNFVNPVIYTVTAANGSTETYTVTVTIAPNTAKDITRFEFLAEKNPAITTDVTAVINGFTIAATVPFGTNVSALVATFATTGASVSVGGLVQASGITPNNFAAPVLYTVTADDGSINVYTVTVTIALNTAKDITRFEFLSADNPGLGANVIAEINGNAIAATVPFGTNVSALAATFATTGASVTVGGVEQTSGFTRNNFAAPVIYTVTADDGLSQTYTVTVIVARNTAKEITRFEFLSANNGGLGADVLATINGTAITATFPFGTDVSALAATFATTGASVTVGGVEQTSGFTRNNFAAPVIYTVTADDGVSQTYTVTVTIARNTAKELTAFSFLSANNGGLGADVLATINGTAITATFPFGTDVSALAATFATTGASVTVGGVEQTSGFTRNNFAAPVIYTVTADDGVSQTYTVTVTIARNTAKELTAFSFLSANNGGLGADVLATINGTAITATFPFGTDVSALAATFATTGASVTVGGVEQTSGFTRNNFAAPVIYTVTADDGLSQTYTVTVIVARNTAKEITRFEFLSANNGGLGADVLATINGTAITATFPFGTDVSALAATFATTGASVTVGGVEQTSGFTRNNFAAPVIYTVTADDGLSQTYTVTVIVARNTAKEITAFSFLSANNGLGADVIATFNGNEITATVPFGTDVSALAATFATTGASVTVGGVEQTSGFTRNNFTAPVIYTVTADDGLSQTYTVTVIVARNTAKEITAFSFLSANNGLGADVIATFNGNEITATVPFGTDVSALAATFATTGASVTVGGVEQTSGFTRNNFTAPVIYTVTADDGLSQTYTVTVIVAPNTAKEITAFSFLSANNGGLGADVLATINGTAITATVPFGTNVSALAATFATTGGRVAVGGVEQTSGVTRNSFAATVLYTVTADDGSLNTYTVIVAVAPNTAKDITSFELLTTTPNPNLFVNAAGTITGTTITLDIAPSANIASLIPTFAITGNRVLIGTTLQISGITPNNFTSPVSYTVVADDGSTKIYTVQVRKLLASFSFSSGTTGNSDGMHPGLSQLPVMTRGNAVTASNAPGAFGATNWSQNPTIVTNKSFLFTVTPATGRTLTMTQLALSDLRSTDGPLLFKIFSSLDGFANELGTFDTHAAFQRTTLQLGAQFANVTGPVTFRFNAYQAPIATGSWRVDSVQLAGSTSP